MLADLILIALVLINALIGLKRGLLIMLGRLLILALSLAVALLLLSPLAGLLVQVKFLMPATAKLIEKVILPLQQTAASVGEMIRSLKLPPFLAEWVQKQLPAGGSSQAVSGLTAILYRFALNALVFVVLFVLAALLIHLVARSLTKMSDAVPVIGTLNRIAGLVAGLLLGAAEVMVILLVLGFLAPYLPAVAAQIESSWIARHFYALNILFYLVYAP